MIISGDLLSASALALAAITVFYGLWSPEITESINCKMKAHKDDRRPEIEAMKNARKNKLMPLLISTVTIVLILFPPTANVVTHVYFHFLESGSASLKSYDATQALFVVVWIMFFGMAGLNLSTFSKISKKINDFEKV